MTDSIGLDRGSAARMAFGAESGRGSGRDHARVLEAQRDFAGVLAKARQGEGTPQQRAREAAEQLVATALVQPVLKELRSTDRTAEPFKPNQAERTFRSMMDAELAQRMVRSRGWALVDRVAEKLLRA